MKTTDLLGSHKNGASTFLLLCGVFGVLLLNPFFSWNNNFLFWNPAFSYADYYELDIWWPVNSAEVSGTQPFKAMLKNKHISEYASYWQVDGGQLNYMYDSYADYPHKEAVVDLNGWTWRGDGPYAINFITKDWNGNLITQKSVSIFVDSGQNYDTANSGESSSFNPFFGKKLFINPNSRAKAVEDEWRRQGRFYDADLLDKIAQQPTAIWFGSWNSNIYEDVKKTTDLINDAAALPVYIAYNIPKRDCGGYSSNTINAEGYRKWIKDFARGIGNNKAVVILEPDALAALDCLSVDDQNERYTLIKEAIEALNNQNNISVYLDAGHPGWLPTTEMANRLKKTGVSRVRGFALNVSNFYSTEADINYGKQIAALIDNKPFIIDTSRNGRGPTPDYQWCNPWGRALGQKPTSDTKYNIVDAFLWLKTPGESDGNCNGGPPAGSFWPEYALDLVRNANW